MAKNSTTTIPRDDLPVLTAEYVAQLFEISKETVYRLYREKKIPAMMLGGELRFRQKDIDKFIDDGYRAIPAKRSYTKRTRPHAKKSSAVAHEQTRTES